MARCEECGKPIVLIDPTPNVISLNRAWVHVNWLGFIKRGGHAPVVSE